MSCVSFECLFGNSGVGKMSPRHMELHQMPQNQFFSHGIENMSETARNDRILC